jgi:excinuclease ABC subunit A
MKNHKIDAIRIIGARQNNLKNISIDLPLKKMTVITGVSGSGKSSLAFDTIYAEGQRRYVETFSSYARQFLDRMDRPDVDRIEGMPPAVAIDQTNPVRTSRSTVGTMTELNDHLKLLFARTAFLLCNGCGKEVVNDNHQTIYEKLTNNYNNKEIHITFTVNVPENFGHDEIVQLLAEQGYVNLLKDNAAHIEVLQDRTMLKIDNRSRIIEDLEMALLHGKGKICVYIKEKNGRTETLYFSSGLHCPDCDITFKDPVPNLFSFNSPIGACDTCRGFGRVIGVNYNAVIPDTSRTLAGGAIKPWQTDSYKECQDDMIRFAKKKSIPVDVPWCKLTDKHKSWVIDGDGEWDQGVWYGVKRFFEWLESRSYKMHIRVLLSKYRGYYTCKECGGARLKADAFNWRIDRELKLSIHDCMLMPVDKALDFFNQYKKTISSKDEAAHIVLNEICTRMQYLSDVGLGYLNLDRQSRTLSGGEVQRINLTTALGTSLVNTLFVLDEPSIGLHSRDINRLIMVLHKLRDAGNTLLIVEHDPEVIRAADYLMDMGPGPGLRGGEILHFGTLQSLDKAKRSVTAQYLSGKKKIETSALQTTVKKNNKVDYLYIKGAAEHNLKSIDVKIPLGQLVCITGVSGSGKSTLVQDICYNGLLTEMGRPDDSPGKYDRIEGFENISDVMLVDQTPIGKTTRSNPVSYVGAFEPIRKAFANVSLAKQRGYTAGTFSFNSGTGRCPVCSGNGFELVEMQFLSDLYLRCTECNGSRFRSEILEVKICSANEDDEKSISEVLDMTIEDACHFFSNDKKIMQVLKPLIDVGLSYMKLGQPLPTLSGGEAQRLKLAGYLAETKIIKNKKALLFFDEPTTGLHFEDISVLMNALRALVQAGHSVVVIEHNLDVIKNADWVIDLGPEGGECGGEIVFSGTPEQLIQCKKSYTGSALKKYETLFSKSFDNVKMEQKNSSASGDTHIEIRQAREHNLKNIDICIPRDELTVITGVSGSGKSTIAFDILFAEGQRRYLESLNAYARQFVQPAAKADVDAVTGLPPTVAIEQRTSRGGRKSTVATVTEIYHFLRLLYVKLGVQYCPDCQIPIKPQTEDAICAEIIKGYKNSKVRFFAPLVVNRKGIYNDLAKWALDKRYKYLRVDGESLSTEKWPKIDRFKEHSIDLPLGEFTISEKKELELRGIVEDALYHGKGNFYIESGLKKCSKRVFSSTRTCPGCQRSFEEIDPRFFSFNSKHGWCPNCFGTGMEIQGFDENQTGEEIWWNEWFEGADKVCRQCNGKRLNRDALAVKVNDKSISDYTALSVLDLSEIVGSMKWSERDALIANEISKELKSRLDFLTMVGLEYMTLDRSAPTLSGGEAQRIRLASQLGSNLCGVCYILDEPTIGLHPDDNEKLLSTLKMLKTKGNTVVVVEHDEDTIKNADYIIDMGPGGGIRGGSLIAKGTLDQLMQNPESVTGRYLQNPISHKRVRRNTINGEFIQIRNATLHNLKSVNVSIPLGKLVCVTGVSGSGKSTLVRDVLYDNCKKIISNEINKVYGCESISGLEHIYRILEVDQSPIGKTPRSCPATYIGFFDDIRKLFAKTSEAMIRGYDASRFSFNVDKGRCPFCDGQGIKKIEMSFLPDVAVVCEDCKGKRFNKDTMEILFKDKSIADVLNMNVDTAVEFFTAHPVIHRALLLLQEVGLGYITLGQQSPTLSGGEAQRIKLVTELEKNVVELSTRNKKRSNADKKGLYILDEPTVGLHMADVEKLIKVLHRLVDSGNSVVVIEHNLDIIAEADWVIDLGPEGGKKGGKIVVSGTPEDIVRKKDSLTGKYLKDYLKR